MCGRFYLDVRADELKATLGLSNAPESRPRYNIAPSQPILAVVAGDDGRVGRWFRWWLIPAWAKDEKLGYYTINAWVETVAEKPAFRSAFKHRRCLIPASGYFEWKAEAVGKQPYCIRPTESPLLVFAGLYEHWHIILNSSPAHEISSQATGSMVSGLSYRGAFMRRLTG